jgi:hypothetical protein
VYLLFLDESGKIDLGGLFALGGIAIRDSDWPELRQRWQETLRTGRWPLDREIKWHGIRSGDERGRRLLPGRSGRVRDDACGCLRLGDELRGVRRAALRRQVKAQPVQRSTRCSSRLHARESGEGAGGLMRVAHVNVLVYGLVYRNVT